MRAVAGWMVAALLAIAAPADAASWRDFGFKPGVQSHQGRAGQAKGDRPREFRPHRPVDRDERPHGRLTEEERRQLHRDLDKANREIYRRRAEK